MVCDPIARLEVVKTAIPAEFTAPVPRTTAPSLNVMLPLAAAGTAAVNVTDALNAAGFAEEDSTTVGVIFATTTCVAGEVAALLVSLAATVAVIGFGPSGSEGTVIVADPLTTGAVPITVPPSEKVTGPVVPGGTCSVIVTGVSGAGVVDDTVGGGRDGVVFVTVTEVAGEVAALLLASAGVLAVIESVPTGRFEIVMVATPPTIGAVPIGVEPLEKVTGPVTPGGTVSEIVSELPTVDVVAETAGGGSDGDALLTVCVKGPELAAL